MLTIGIDPGTAITGYGIVQESSAGNLSVVDYGVITTSSKMEMADRLVLIYEELRRIVEKHQPDVAAVEKLFFQKNVRTAISVGQARGVAILALAQSGLAVSEYTPLEIKQAVTGYGGADKYQMQSMVKALLNLGELPQPDDAADALAVAICQLHSRKMENL
ncbi:MAG: crossover junction endodeoxyribonuclease RuvC [candidate division Zixibacteria bacterium]|nr:crossover junction endodeoxyribonuclease RuvC [candidate division Zixibacteria bacterium]NIS44646.1 crossover junction endodeoxyribonuclease RuvC [candidate division Zixibacteria bacterium]NIU12703.1 crossover junction endodeoxyribonuclease RuvC [candidate division Zixibacteria bacterium]NIV04808.1 crossover junction endodeoxyribonuclease RuvC [candidate division Zixibacteria bacterium]NIW43489.1 crossover junction endodeoxyribonuclease RuvC [Gammaproteobacteria bacterium]